MVEDVALASHRRSLDALTSLRFFAAASIVWLHVGGAWSIPVGHGFNLGFGVSFFFVLSGFILTYRYGEVRGRASVLRFLRARFARIWPAYMTALIFVVMTVTSVLAYFPGQHLVPVLISNTLMVQAWLPFDFTSTSLNGPSWSVSTEFALYLMFPWLSWNFRRTWPWKLGMAIGIALGIDLTCRALGLHSSNGAWTALNSFPLSQTPEFILGMCAALVWRAAQAKAIRIGLWWGTAAEIAALALLGMATLSPSPLQLRVPDVLTWLVKAGVPSVSAATLILVMGLGSGLISRALAMRPFVFLGEISYSIYLLHAGVSAILQWDFPKITGIEGTAIYVASVLISSTLMWALIECPARRVIVTGRLWPTKKGINILDSVAGRGGRFAS